MSIAAKLGLPAVVLGGVVNAVSGGLLRDIVMRQVPELFKPGTFTGVAALASCFVPSVVKSRSSPRCQGFHHTLVLFE